MLLFNPNMLYLVRISKQQIRQRSRILPYIQGHQTLSAVLDSGQ